MSDAAIHDLSMAFVAASIILGLCGIFITALKRM